MIPKLEVDGVSYSYHSLDGEIPTLDHTSLDVSPGEFSAIVELSGCDKPTLPSMLRELTQPEGGTIGTDGIPLTKSPSAVGYMLQGDHLFEWRNIFPNMFLGLEIQERSDEPARQELLEMMAAYDLAGFEYAKPSELSGGIHQRTTLIRTLAPEPDLLLLGEPSSALGYQTRLSMCDDVSSIIHQTHKTAILVTHDLSEAISMIDRTLILSPRPSRVKEILSIGFPKMRARSLDRRNCPEFSTYFNVAWEGLETYK